MLVASGKFNITAVARHNSSSQIPSTNNLRQVKADFSSHQALVDAFRGNEALVLTLGDFPNLGKNTQILTDAAIDAGIKRVILSEFGKCVFSPLHYLAWHGMALIFGCEVICTTNREGVKRFSRRSTTHSRMSKARQRRARLLGLLSPMDPSLTGDWPTNS